MKVYRWDSFERRFLPSPIQDHTPSGENVLLFGLQVKKGETFRSGGCMDERMICLLRGSWRMNIADDELMVRRSEAVIIPEGFDHTAEALEDSFAIQMVRQSIPPDESYLWGI